MEIWQILILAVIGLAAVLLMVSRRRRSGLTEEDVSTRLAAPRRGFADALRSVFRRSGLDDEFWVDLEEGLLALDLGVDTASKMVATVRDAHPADGEAVKEELRSTLLGAFSSERRALRLNSHPTVVLVVGVNGTGKTTTIAKLAAHLQEQGKTTLLGAADTFRAGAGAQLREWAGRVGVDLVGGQEGADPAAVAFDAYQAARARGNDVVLIDTAGRQHSRQNLMAELDKVVRVLSKEAGTLDEVLLVLDASTGQNGLTQARVFTEAVGVTGVVLTKLDGTAKGGIVVAVEQDLGVPIKFIGVGESLEDLLPFRPEEFVDALMSAV